MDRMPYLLSSRYVLVTLFFVATLVSGTRSYAAQSKISREMEAISHEQVAEQATNHSYAALERVFEKQLEDLIWNARLAGRNGDLPNFEKYNEAKNKLEQMIRAQKEAMVSEFHRTPVLWGEDLDRAMQKHTDEFQKALIKAKAPVDSSPNAAVEALFPLLEAARAYQCAVFLAFKSRNPSVDEMLLSRDPKMVANAKRVQAIGKTLSWGIIIGNMFGAHFASGAAFPDMSLVQHLFLDIPVYFAMNYAAFGALKKVATSKLILKREQVKLALAALDKNFFGRMRDFHGAEDMPAKVEDALADWIPQVLQDAQKSADTPAVDRLCEAVATKPMRFFTDGDAALEEAAEREADLSIAPRRLRGSGFQRSGFRKSGYFPR